MPAPKNGRGPAESGVPIPLNLRVDVGVDGATVLQEPMRLGVNGVTPTMLFNSAMAYHRRREALERAAAAAIEAPVPDEVHAIERVRQGKQPEASEPAPPEGGEERSDGEPGLPASGGAGRDGAPAPPASGGASSDGAPAPPAIGGASSSGQLQPAAAREPMHPRGPRCLPRVTPAPDIPREGKRPPRTREEKDERNARERAQRAAASALKRQRMMDDLQREDSDSGGAGNAGQHDGNGGEAAVKREQQ